jgi:hypothetical protein
VAGFTGVSRVAVFTARESLPAGRFTVTLQQSFGQKDHTLGRFRISGTTAANTLPVGAPLDIRMAATAAKRTPKQSAALAKYLKQLDPNHAKLLAAVAAARQPRPTDPRLAALTAAAEELAKPLPPDEVLAQLKTDLGFSRAQAAAARLTGAQDIAWALINSPAFLFNR